MASDEQQPHVFLAPEQQAQAPQPQPLGRKRKAGRRRDEVWLQTTVHPDKTVVCNRCNMVIHRYGTTKVERVRAHFERKCLQSKKPRLGNAITDGSAASVAAVGGDAKAPRPGYGNKNNVFKRRFAQWVYATGQSFDAVENDLLLNALKVLRSDVELPTKHELENELLDMEFVASQVKVGKALNGKPCCLTVESSVDAAGNAVTSYGARCESTSYFLESKPNESQESGGELAADEVETVLAKHKKGIFDGVVTPTTLMLSKATRERIQKKHPQCVFYHGCVCDALGLLVCDVSSVLPWLEKVRLSVAELAKVFYGNHKLQSQLRNNQESGHYAVTEFPDSSSVCASLQSVLDREKELYPIVARRDFVEANSPAEQDKLKRVQDFVLSDSFVRDLSNALLILRPLQQHLQHFRSERTPISQVYPYFMDLLRVYSSMEWVNKKEKALLTSCVMERLNAIYGDSHGVAYMLDPLYLGEALDAGKKREVERFIARYCEREEEDVDILAHLAEYKEMVADLKENDPEYWKSVESGAVRPYEFWVERQQFSLLQELALAAFALPASCSSPTQAFGPQGDLTYSRFGDTLSPEKLQKLTHVFCNAKSKPEGDLPNLVILDV